MKSPVKKMYFKMRRLKITPPWMVLSIDTIAMIFSIFLSIVIRNNFKFTTNLGNFYWITVPVIVLIVRIFYSLVFKTSRAVVRYTNTQDAARIFFVCFLGSLTLGVINLISYLFTKHVVVPSSILIMEFFITTVILISYRFAFKLYYLETKNPSKSKRDIIIYGAGESGITAKRAIDRDNASKYNVLAFFDENPQKIGMKLENLPVYEFSYLPEYLRKNDISFIIIAVQKIANSKVNEITEAALPLKIKVLKVPPVSHWINGMLSFKQIKKIKIEDLLERDPIQLNLSLLNSELSGQTILITGAAGSIGSEIVRQLLQFQYKQLILVDETETPCFFLQNELIKANGMKNIDLRIMDICDEPKMKMLMELYHPDIIYHAAAYKHVPMMENNVHAAIQVNVGGTKMLADMAAYYGVKKFVMISTDKAVNPTSVMGASKRIAEMYVQALNFNQTSTKFVTTRFGNVLDSNGSVITIFRRQIENGGPVTVTHPDITRYFMTISEACQLVITAGAMGKGGEIFIFNMGKSVRVYDLAKKMIQLSDLTLGRDISIEFTGLRPGEKLFEELLANQENTIETTHKKIMIAKVRPCSYDTLSPEINELIAMQNDNEFDIVAKMKKIVPEYKSHNSIFETIDRQTEKLHQSTLPATINNI